MVVSLRDNKMRICFDPRDLMRSVKPLSQLAHDHFTPLSVPYEGHIFSAEGISLDFEKIRALCNMPAPIYKEELRKFLGLVHCLCKFTPNINQIDAPPFQWYKTHQESFDKLKNTCSTASVFELFDVSKPREIPCDNSKDGLEIIFMQEARVTAYSSRAFTEKMLP